MEINQVKNFLPKQCIKDFDDINNQKILGASNHIRMIGNMIEEIVNDAISSNQSIQEMKDRIKIVTNFFIKTRGEASQAVTNALYLMTKDIDKYNDEDINIVGKNIIDDKNQYYVKSKNDTEIIIDYAYDLLKDMNNIFIYDYSSTVEKIIKKLDSGKNIYIAESRIINGGLPFVKTCQEKGMKITFLPDAAIMYFLKKCDVALMGAETFYPDGTGFNTTGSDIVGLVCKKYEIPLYFATPLIKVDYRPLVGKKKNIVFNCIKEKAKSYFSEDINMDEIDFSTPELLAVKPEYITAYITEKGIIPSYSMYDVSVEYLKGIRGGKNEV